MLSRQDNSQVMKCLQFTIVLSCLLVLLATSPLQELQSNSGRSASTEDGFKQPKIMYNEKAGVIALDGSGYAHPITLTQIATKLQLSEVQLDAVTEMRYENYSSLVIEDQVFADIRLVIYNSTNTIIRNNSFQGYDLSEETAVAIISVEISNSTEITNNVFEDFNYAGDNLDFSFISITGSHDITIQGNSFGTIYFDASGSVRFIGISVSSGSNLLLDTNQFTEYEIITSGTLDIQIVNILNIDGFKVSNNYFGIFLGTSASDTIFRGIMVELSGSLIETPSAINFNTIEAIELSSTSGIVDAIGISMDLGEFDNEFSLEGNEIVDIIVNTDGVGQTSTVYGVFVINFIPSLDSNRVIIRHNLLTGLEAYASDLATVHTFHFEFSNNLYLKHLDQINMVGEVVYEVLLVDVESIMLDIQYNSIQAIHLAYSLANIDTFNVTESGSIVEVGELLGNIIKFDLTSYNLESHTYQFNAYDLSNSASASTEITFTILDEIAPFITGNIAVTIYNTTPFVLLNWTIVEDFTDTYTIYRDGIFESSGTVVCCEVQYNVTTFEVGSFQFKIEVVDTSGNLNSYTTTLNVEKDLQPPVIVDSPGSFVDELGNFTTLSWFVEDSGPDSYMVYLNGSIVINGTWFASNITVELGQLPIGIHNITLWLNNTDGLSTTDTVFISILDTLAPQLSHPPDISFFEEEAAKTTLTWMVIDAGSVEYSIYMNQQLLVNWTRLSGTAVELTMDLVNTAYTNFTIFALDGSGNMSNDTVNVIRFVDFNSSPTSSSQKSGGDITLPSNTLLIIGGVVVGATAVFALLRRR